MSFVSVTKWICAGCQANMSDQSGFKSKCQSSSCREQQWACQVSMLTIRNSLCRLWWQEAFTVPGNFRTQVDWCLATLRETISLKNT